jgi:TP901 family phage tail tape measure protein
MNAPIGSLRVDLGVNVGEFTSGLVKAQGALSKFAHEVSEQFQRLEATIKKVGVGLTAGITAPFAAMTVASGRGAGGFEAAMNRVQAALNGISAKQLAEISKQARLLGPEVGKSAVEAADGVETLALAGMSAEGILGGGLAATLKLAAANVADLGSAGALVTDVLKQFGKTSSDLPVIVNQVTGALDSSKFAFIDFQQAVSQAGGVAGSAGVSFEDFNTAIAATSALFASGSDAGTSFKTFITSLNPKSDEAAFVMNKLGLSFFDATGKMRDLGDIAQQLQEKLGGLSERSRTEALTKMFGTDAMRTAIGLMQQGKKGFEDLQATIAKGDAGNKLAIQMQGYEAAANRLGAAFESLKISIGDTGLLSVLTGMATALANMANAIAQANPIVLTIGVSLWAFSAAIGPLMLAILGLAKLAVPLAIGRLGIFGTAVAALINPIGALAGLLVKLAIAFTGASSAFTMFATALGRFLGPIGLVITALTLLYLYTNRGAKASGAYQKATEELAAAQAKNTEIVQALAMATGEARKQALANARAARAEAIEHLKAAKAALAHAMANRENARAATAMNIAASVNTARAGGPDSVMSAISTGRRVQQQVDADAAAAINNLRGYANEVERMTGAINASVQAGDVGTTDLSFEKPDKAKKAREKKDRSEDLARRREEIALQQQLDVATARGDMEEQRRVEQIIELKRREYDYEEAGLSVAVAREAAARDMADLQAARDAWNAKEIEQAEMELDLQAAELRGDHVFIKQRENELFIRRQIQFWREKGIPLGQAEIQAARDLAHLEAARLDMQKQINRERDLDRQAELSRLRADTDGVVRQRERAAELERRTREFEERDRISPDRARERAERELNEEEEARLQGDFRRTFRDGVRAALDGDLKDFVKNWWKERLTKSLEDALNNVADMLFKLFRQAMSQGTASGSQGGGFFQVVGQVLGLVRAGAGLAGSSGPALSGADGPVMVGSVDYSGLPGFKTGGQFTVGGRSGIDANVVSFRATRGEIVDVKRPGSASSGLGKLQIVPSPYFDVVVDGRVVKTAGPMAHQAASAGSAGAISRLTRRQARTFP